MNKLRIAAFTLALLLVSGSAFARKRRHKRRHGYTTYTSVYYPYPTYPVASLPMVPVTYPVVYPGYVTPAYAFSPVISSVPAFSGMVSPYSNVNFYFGF